MYITKFIRMEMAKTEINKALIDDCWRLWYESKTIEFQDVETFVAGFYCD